MVSVFGPAPIRGVGRTGGFKFVVEDRGDVGLKELQRQTDNLVAKGNQLAGGPAARSGRAVQRLPRQRAANVRRHQPQAVHGAWACPWATSSTRCKSTSARCTSTTSTSSAAPGRSSSRPMPPSAIKSETVGQLKVRNNSGGMVPLGTLADVRDINGPLIITRYNMYRRPPSTAPPAPGISSRQGIDMMAAAGRQGIALRHGLRMDRNGLPGAAGGQHGHVDFRLGRADGLSGAGGPVRKLVAAAGGDPRGAHVPVERGRRRLGGASMLLAQVASSGGGFRPTSTSSRRSASWCWSAWPARTRS